MIKPPPSVSFIGTFGLTLLAIAGLFTFDTFLEKIDHAENDVEAVRLFKEGQGLLAKGESAKAIDHFSDAIEIDRSNRDYQRALAQAQLAAGSTSEAQTTLAKLLETDTSDGFASLLMARALMKEDKFQEAVSYYHRAIFGRWNEDEKLNRRRVRNELINLLAQRSSKEDLLAELMAVQEQTPQDIKSRIRMGDLFLQAGSPVRAIEIFHRVLHDQPANVEAHLGVGEAEFSEGNYRVAQAEFQTATRLNPDDAAVRQRLEVCDQVLELDPMLRGLSTSDRFERSSRVLQQTLAALNQCASPESSPDMQQLTERAETALKAKVTAAQRSEASQANLDLAEQLWGLRKKECKVPLDAQSPLRLVLARLTQ